MKAIATRQVAAIDWREEVSWCFVAASGYESRAPHAAMELITDNAHVDKRVFGFAKHQVGARRRNDEVFAELGFSAVDNDTADSAEGIRGFIRSLIATTQVARLGVVIDYSCMTKIWYGEIIRTLTEIDGRGLTIDAYFVYSPAAFTPPGPPGVNRVAGAIPGFCRLSAPTNPTALILGLGYEAVRAMGLRDFLDPELTLAFYTDPALQQEFATAVMCNNRGLLNTLPRNMIFRHPMADLDYTAALLRNVASGLHETHRVIVAPLGPKPFCLLSLLLAADCRCIDVWRVSGAGENVPQERAPMGDVLIYKVTFSGEPISKEDTTQPHAE